MVNLRCSKCGGFCGGALCGCSSDPRYEQLPRLAASVIAFLHDTVGPIENCAKQNEHDKRFE